MPRAPVGSKPCPTKRSVFRRSALSTLATRAENAEHVAFRTSHYLPTAPWHIVLVRYRAATVTADLFDRSIEIVSDQVKVHAVLS